LHVRAYGQSAAKETDKGEYGESTRDQLDEEERVRDAHDSAARTFLAK